MTEEGFKIIQALARFNGYVSSHLGDTIDISIVVEMARMQGTIVDAIQISEYDTCVDTVRRGTT